MNRFCYFFLLSGLMFVMQTINLFAWGEDPAKPMNNNSNVNNVTNNITVNTDVSTEVANLVYNQIKENVREVKEQIKKVCEKVSTVAVACAQRITRKKVILLTFLGGYSCGTGVNLYFSSYVKNPLRWCHWNEQLSLEELFAMPQEKLGTEIVKEIQRRYVNLANPVDFITPFVMFMRDIDTERAILLWYKRLGYFERKVYLSRIMFNEQFVYEHCQEWLERIAYLHAVFLRWMADFKFLQNARLLQMIVNKRLWCASSVKRIAEWNFW